MKIEWRKSKHTDGLSDAEKSAFYKVRAMVVRSLQTMDKRNMEDNKEVELSGLQSAMKPLSDYSEDEIDALAREAFDTGKIPQFNGETIVLQPAVVTLDMPA